MADAKTIFSASLRDEASKQLKQLENNYRQTISHIEEAGDGGVVNDPTAVRAALDDLDIRLLRWLTSAVLTATQYLLNLGEGSARLSLSGVGVAVPTKNPTAMRGTASN